MRTPGHPRAVEANTCALVVRLGHVALTVAGPPGVYTRFPWRRDKLARYRRRNSGRRAIMPACRTLPLMPPPNVPIARAAALRWNLRPSRR